ncbi:MAG: agmatine deiminase [Clostridia bacterium]|nr:agmatine deiminase [Clostridia bacterium]
MIINNSLPINDGFSMPAEFDRHRATILIWPVRPGSWTYNAKYAQQAFSFMANELSKHETVYLLTNKRDFEDVKERFATNNNIKVLQIESDDSWARDTAPTFLKNDSGELRAVNWQFNAWGGSFDGLYDDYENDNKLAGAFCRQINVDYYDATPFVLEGGSIHSDGEGTIITTEACLLSEGRNPTLSKDEISQKLMNYLGAKKVIWLPNGIYNDETNEHVDNVCAFIAPAEVVLAWTDDKNDPQYALSKACLDVLENSTDAKGRKFTVHKLPIPKKTVCITQFDLDGFVFEAGEAERVVGERLAASYVNFYFANDIILLPQFGGENEASDKLALDIISKLCPNRVVVPVDAINLIVGGGNIHCVTQQIPE